MKLVVWFPGLGSFANVSGNILEYFEKDTDTDVLCVSYDTFGTGSYLNAAQRLSGPLEAILDRYDEVFYIGHSMGGHVGATLVRNFGHRITKLVALSSPQTKFWALPLISQLYSHAILEDFGSHPIWPNNIPTLNIYGQLDILANPASPLLSKVTDNDKKNIRDTKIPYHSHLSILWSSKAAAEIYAFCTYEDVK